MVARGHKKRMKRSQVFEDRDESAREGSSMLERTIRVKRKPELEDNGVDDNGNNGNLPKLFEHPCEACFKARRYCQKVKTPGMNICTLCHHRKWKCLQIDMMKQRLAQAPSRSKVRGRGASKAPKGKQWGRSVSICC